MTPPNGAAAARIAAAMTFCIGLMLALGAAVWQRHHNRVAAQQAFDALAAHSVDEIQTRLRRYDYGLHGLRGAVIAGGLRAITQEQVRQYSESRDIDREFPGARGFGVVWRVPQAQQERFVAGLRAGGQPDFAIRQLQPRDGERLVISFIEPLARNRAALGLDIASEPHRRQAALDAMHSGRAALSAPVTLVQSPGQQSSSFLLMLPIYQQQMPLQTPAQREAATLGWTYAPLVADEVLNGLYALGRTFHLALYDRSGPQPDQAFYGGHSPAAADDADGLPATRSDFELHGRRWQARLQATPAFVDGLDQTAPLHTGLAGAALATLLANVVWLWMHGRARAQREWLEVARRATIIEGSEDAIIGATPDGEITEWNAGAERLFGYQADEALGRRIEDLLLPEDRRAEDRRFLATIASGRRVPPFDTLRRHRDGTLIAVSLTAGPILDARGQCVGMAKTLRDMREAQRARAELAALNTSLEQQVASRTEALETALRDNTALLQTLDRFAIVTTADRQGLITAVNARFCRVSGFEAEELLGRSHRMLASDGQDAAFWQQMWTQLEGGQPWRGEIHHRAKDGSDYWIDSIVAPFLDAAGRIEKFVSISADITPIKRLQQEAERARQAAEEANRFLQEVTDRLPLRVAYLDNQHRFRFVNAAQCEAYGLPREQLLGRQPRVFVDGVPPAELQPAFDAVLRGESHIYEASLQLANGEHSDYEVRLVADRRADGQVDGYYSVATDISARKRTEQELRRTLTTLRAVLDAATQVSILSVDCLGRVNLFNRGAEKLTGYAAAEVLGRDAVTLLHTPEELAERSAALSAQLGRRVDAHQAFVDPSTMGCSHDWHYRRKDGALVPVSVAVTPINDDAGELLGFLGIAHDISARREFERSLQQAVAHANQANRAKSEFLANMSHEIRTPMNAVIGLSHLLERSPLDADQAGLVKKIKLAGKGLLGLINDVLDLSKIEAAEMSMERAPFSLPALIDDLGELLAVQAQTRGIAFTVQRPADLPTALEGDATRLRQVPTNLLSNAIKFTDDGEVRLEVMALPGPADGPLRLRFNVRDTSIGIAPDALERIFQPFAQADASTTRRYGGTGLGLSIVRQLVTLMGGRLDVRSEPGVGSEFGVELALPRSEAWLPPPTSEAGSEPGQALAGVRVLVVDDSDINLEVARRLLEAEGARVSLAANGQQAVDRLMAAPQARDIVLMDVQMPVLDGHDATRRIRSALGLRALPIIALTAGVTQGERQRAAEAGMDDMMGKPFDPQSLVACMRRHLGRGTAPAQQAIDPPVDQPVATPAGTPVDWPEIAGLDAAEAHRRLGGDRALLRTLLGRLLAEAQDLALPTGPGDASDLPALARRLHRLRGNAGTLAAHALAREAGEAERACLAGDAEQARRLLAPLPRHLPPLRAALQVLDAQASAPAAPTGPAPSLDGAALQTLLGQLHRQDLAALAGFTQLLPALCHHLGDAAGQRLRGLMEALDFEAVARELEPLART